MTINCQGKLIALTSPKIMGILNITPDSFYDGGNYQSNKAVLQQTALMLEQGATFIDIGAYSSRPGATAITEKEEIARIAPMVGAILKEFPEALLSIDTFNSTVADTCLDMGAHIINDISGGAADENMYAVVAKYRAPYVMMHMRGTPETMQEQTQYKHLVTDILYYFSERIGLARDAGIQDIIIDPGFGFAKNRAQNYQLLQQLHLFKTLDLPLLAGLSRKSMIYKVLQTNASEALNGTTVLNTFALSKGANILRVHDVKEAVECVQLMKHIQP